MRKKLKDLGGEIVALSKGTGTYVVTNQGTLVSRIDGETKDPSPGTRDAWFEKKDGDAFWWRAPQVKRYRIRRADGFWYSTDMHAFVGNSDSAWHTEEYPIAELRRSILCDLFPLFAFTCEAYDA